LAVCSKITKLLNGARKINYELAVILGNTFNIEPSLWLRIQDKNEFVQLSRINSNNFSAYSLKRLFEFAAVL
jgi:plasmid maintenance system antidote protein VapI